MKKFSKLLAVVLALAVIICPMMSAMSVSADASAGTYKMEKVSETELKLTISSTNGFLVYQAAIAFTGGNLNTSAEGYTNGVKLINYTLVSKTKDDYNLPNVSVNPNGTTLNVLVASTDASCLDLYSSVVIGLAVSKDTTATLSKIQAADEGDGQTTTSDATLLAFPAAGEDGTIDPDATDYPADDVSAKAHTCVKKDNPTADQDNLKDAASHASGNVYWDTCATCGAQFGDSYWEDTSSKIAHAWSYTTNSNGTHNATCSGCNETITNEACDTTGTDGACSKCGYKATSTEPVVDSAIELENPCLPNISAGLRMRIRVMRTTLKAEYASVKLTITPKKYTSGTNPYNEYTAPAIELVSEKTTTNFYAFFYDDIDMRELGLSFSVVVDCYDVQGNYIAKSNPFSITPEVELKKLYNNPTSSASLKNILANMLDMGAKAQKYFAYASTAAANSDLRKAVDAGNLVNVGIATSDILTNPNSLTVYNPDAVWSQNAPFTSTDHKMETEVLLGKAPTVQFSIFQANAEGFDTTKLSLDVSYTSNKENSVVQYTISGSDANTFRIVGSKAKVALPDLAYYDSNITITATLKYNGTECWTKQYTLESGLNTLRTNQAATDNLIALVDSISNFGYAARQYTSFGK